MAYLYHLVPENVRGDILYPLNQLKNIYPDIYESAANKYAVPLYPGGQGSQAFRETVLNWKIPYFDCYWNDVLHLSPVTPAELKQTFMEANPNYDRIFRHYQIDPYLLDPKQAVVYLYDDAGHDLTGEGFPPSDPDHVKNYNPHEVATLPTLSRETKTYYKAMTSQGKRPLIYRRVTHVLYKGTLKISDLKIVSA